MAATLYPKGENSGLSTASRRENGNRPRRRTTSGNSVTKSKKALSAIPTSMDRTKRLLLAALRVWELKQRMSQ